MKSNAEEYVQYLLKQNKDTQLTEDEFYSMLKNRRDINYFNPDLKFIYYGKTDKEDKDDSTHVKVEAQPDFLISLFH